MKLKHLFTLLIALPIFFGLSSCTDGDEEITWSNYVTYEGMQDGYAQVTWQGINDAEPITLLLQANIPSSVLKGSRLFLSFLMNPMETLTDQTIIKPTQLYVVPTIYPDFSSSILPPEGWQEEPSLFISLLFRSGNFINMEALMPNGSNEENMKLQLFVDSQTITQENIVAYLSYTNEAAVMGSVLNVAYNGCINISQLMTKEAQTLTIYMNNSNESLNAGWDPSISTVGPRGQYIIIPLKPTQNNE